MTAEKHALRWQIVQDPGGFTKLLPIARGLRWKRRPVRALIAEREIASQHRNPCFGENIGERNQQRRASVGSSPVRKQKRVTAGRRGAVKKSFDIAALENFKRHGCGSIIRAQMAAVTIVGGGPAGSSAAIAARLEGAEVRLIEKSVFPRHKVCGEFLSPEIAGPLAALKLQDAFAKHRPARIERMLLRFRTLEKSARLPNAAFGLSRYSFDQMLMERAQADGAQLVRDHAVPDDTPLVLACGRRSRALRASRGRRLFGFKAHFDGPASDAIELYFFDGGYAGVSPIEGGRTNVCGLAREDRLAQFAFEIDEFVRHIPALRTRLEPLSRAIDWLTVGPLVFGNRFQDDIRESTYPAGDALSFVDPFTGSGLSAALLTGRLAGQSAARGLATRHYLELCESTLSRPFAAASLFRRALGTTWVEVAAQCVPAALLFRLTRPRLVRS